VTKTEIRQYIRRSREALRLLEQSLTDPHADRSIVEDELMELEGSVAAIREGFGIPQ